MIDALLNNLELFPKGITFIVLSIIILLIAKVIQDILTPFRIGEQLNQKNNAALGLSISGYYLGVIIVFVAVMYEPTVSVAQETSGNFFREIGDSFSQEFWQDYLSAFLYALGSIVVLNIARVIVDRLVLFRFNTAKEIVESQNVGSGAVEFGVYVGVALIIASATASTAEIVGTPDPSTLEMLLRTIIFFILGLGVLIIYSLFYQFTTPFDIHAQIEDGNTAVGVALSGNIIAISLVTFKAVYGDFSTWEQSIIGFLTFALLGFILLYVVRFLIDIILLSGTRVSDELSVDRNLGVAFIESAVVVSAALVLFFSI